jgi:hypothetical protein
VQIAAGSRLDIGGGRCVDRHLWYTPQSITREPSTLTSLTSTKREMAQPIAEHVLRILLHITAFPDPRSIWTVAGMSSQTTLGCCLYLVHKLIISNSHISSKLFHYIAKSLAPSTLFLHGQSFYWFFMAVQPQDDTILPHLDKNSITPRQSSVSKTFHRYHKDVPPPTPLKDTQFRKGRSQRSLDDTFGVLKTNKMPSFPDFYECEQGINSYRRDSLLDPPFFYNFNRKAEDNISLWVDFDHGSTEALLDSYCSSNSSRSTTSPRQSLLPPLPRLSHSSQPPVTEQSLRSPSLGPLPRTPSGEQFAPKPALETLSKWSITPLQLEELRQPSRSSGQYQHSRTPSTRSGLTLNSNRLVAPTFSSASTTTTSCSLQSAMTSVSYSDAMSYPTTAGSSKWASPKSGSRMRKRSKSRKPARLVQPDNFSSTIHGQSVSQPFETKSTSPIGAGFNLNLPSHDFEARRQSPAPPLTDGIASTPILPSPCSTSLGTPTTPSSIQPLLPPFHEQSTETSAFDSDTDDEGLSSSNPLRKMISNSRLTRTRAETVPAANSRNISKGASLPKRISKQDIRTPGLPFSNASDNAAAGCGISTVRTSDSSTASPIAFKPSRATSPPTTLRTKTSNRESSPSKSKRASNASKASKRSCTSSNNATAPPTVTVGGTAGRERKGSPSSGRRLHNWIVRVLGRRNTH